MHILRAQAKEDGTVVLTKERWEHITGRHPEMEGEIKLLIPTVRDPALIVESKIKENTYIYQRKRNTGFTTVVVNMEKEFIVTAYISQSTKQGRILWKKT